MPSSARALLLLASCFVASAQTIPIPVLDQPVIPSAVKPGSPAFTLTVNGAAFRPQSVVLWNGASLATTYISSRQLTALVPAAKVASPQTAVITVSNGPRFVSNQAFLQVEMPRPASFTPDPISTVTPYAFTIGDFNGDHRPDIVAWVQGATVDILLGNGNGTFQNPIIIDPNNIQVTQLLAADLNGDGNQDLVFLGRGSAFTRLGNGDGTFQPPQNLPLGNQTVDFVAAGDFNGDGKLDLVYGDNSTSPAAILLGNGDGTFTAGPSLPSTAYAWAAQTADLNGDGLPDIALAARTPGGIGIFLNDGTGGMTLSATLAGADPAAQFVLADLNGDGLADIAAVDSSTTSVLVYIGTGDGTFQSPTTYPVGTLSGVLISGDFNGDGKLDLLAPFDQGIPGAFSLLAGNGDGTFRSPQNRGGANTLGVIPADFNNDGQLDLIAITTLGATDRLAVLLQTTVLATPGNLTFPVIPVTTASQPLSVALSNTAAAPLTISSLRMSGIDPADFSLATDLCSGRALQTGASCSFSIQFVPALAGARTAVLTVSDNARVAPQSMLFEAVASEISVSPTALDFGTVKVEHAGPLQIVTIANPGTVADAVQINPGGADPQDFLVQNTCLGDIAAGTACSILIRFIPTATGPRTATVSINDTVGTTVLPVTLSGTGN